MTNAGTWIYIFITLVLLSLRRSGFSGTVANLKEHGESAWLGIDGVVTVSTLGLIPFLLPIKVCDQCICCRRNWKHSSELLFSFADAVGPVPCTIGILESRHDDGNASASALTEGRHSPRFRLTKPSGCPLQQYCWCVFSIVGLHL